MNAQNYFLYIQKMLKKRNCVFKKRYSFLESQYFLRYSIGVHPLIFLKIRDIFLQSLNPDSKARSNSARSVVSNKCAK